MFRFDCTHISARVEKIARSITSTKNLLEKLEHFLLGTSLVFSRCQNVKAAPDETATLTPITDRDFIQQLVTRDRWN